MQARAIPSGRAAVEEGALMAVRSRNKRGKPTVRNLMTAGALSALVGLAGCRVNLNRVGRAARRALGAAAVAGEFPAVAQFRLRESPGSVNTCFTCVRLSISLRPIRSCPLQGRSLEYSLPLSKEYRILQCRRL